MIEYKYRIRVELQPDDVKHYIPECLGFTDSATSTNWTKLSTYHGFLLDIKQAEHIIDRHIETNRVKTIEIIEYPYK
jgi:hypothetical protein